MLRKLLNDLEGFIHQLFHMFWNNVRTLGSSILNNNTAKQRFIQWFL
jgi:hypothetical protein